MSLLYKPIWVASGHTVMRLLSANNDLSYYYSQVSNYALVMPTLLSRLNLRRSHLSMASCLLMPSSFADAMLWCIVFSRGVTLQFAVMLISKRISPFKVWWNRLNTSNDNDREWSSCLPFTFVCIVGQACTNVRYVVNGIHAYTSSGQNNAVISTSVCMFEKRSQNWFHSVRVLYSTVLLLILWLAYSTCVLLTCISPDLGRFVPNSSPIPLSHFHTLLSPFLSFFL